MGNGYFSIAAYNAKPTSLTYVILGIRDSVNFIANGKEINIGKNFLGASLYDESSICSRYSDDNLVYSFGKINITKYDKNTRILSGVFNCVLYNRSCGDTIKITNGRFDFKF